MTQGARKVDGKLVLWIENVVSYMAVKNHIYPAKPATHTHPQFLQKLNSTHGHQYHSQFHYQISPG